ncbi:hypothetical protein [Engelhardtia mirabilis]|uniref:DUF4149 domain-containing protein n=1 Tax=Engelhardtia mirabilis TaxID=2528011 RepID=A0A518BF68_9BACT|nr:hypothetical protein Pla133_06860 [Planctomycetes bacterium Pla133]QDU99946.1 hypothetical protein Pla86_06850 [Planctomycetes bacterium Pla86]
MSLLVVHAAATWALFGLIWMVQLVHYPLYALVGAREFPAFEASHARRITPLVAPLMGLELVTGGLLALDPPSAADALPLRVGFGLIVAIWLSTALLQIPCHARLERSFDPATHRLLVATNWLRTAAWTVRAGLVAVVLEGATAAGRS